MLKRASGKASKSLGEGRHGLAAADQRAAHLGVAQRADLAAVVGDPVEDAVVEREQHAVPRHVHVGLEIVVAEAGGMPEGGQRVLQALDLGMVGTATVREGQDAARVVEHGVEVGVAGARGGHG